jgi:hypothetical protein
MSATAFSTFLFANPSFSEGLARVLDAGGTLNSYNVSQTEKQADFLALSADWRAVGKDIKDCATLEYFRLLHEAGHAGATTP